MLLLLNKMYLKHLTVWTYIKVQKTSLNFAVHRQRNKNITTFYKWNFKHYKITTTNLLIIVKTEYRGYKY